MNSSVSQIASARAELDAERLAMACDHEKLNERLSAQQAIEANLSAEVDQTKSKIQALADAVNEQREAIKLVNDNHAVQLRKLEVN